MTRGVPGADAYKWWAGRRVDFRFNGGAWMLAEVVTARHDAIANLGSDEMEFYEPDPGETDGEMHLIVLDEPRRGSHERVEIYPGGLCGIVPNVVVHVDFPEKVKTWWTGLSAGTQSVLCADPSGPVPGSVIPELTRTGPLMAGVFWPEYQSGPTGLMLQGGHVEFLLDRKYEREYVEAQDALDAAVTATSTSLPEAVREGDVKSRLDVRDAAKIQFDEHRLTLLA